MTIPSSPTCAKSLSRSRRCTTCPATTNGPRSFFTTPPSGQIWRPSGVHFLADETETLEVNGNTIAIGGVAEAPASYERYASAYFESFEQLDAFKLLLVHYPEYFLEDGFFSDVPVDLALCGHAHGGMIRIPASAGFTRRIRASCQR